MQSSILQQKGEHHGLWFCSPTFEDIGAVELFEKVLTSSDANSQGRVVIPKVQKGPATSCTWKGRQATQLQGRG